MYFRIDTIILWHHLLTSPKFDKRNCSYTYWRFQNIFYFFCTAFEAEITSINISELSIEYGFNVMTVYKVKHQLTYYCLIIVRFLTLNMFIKLLYCFQKSQTQRNSIPSKRYIHFFLKWEPSFKVNQLVWNIKRISN